MRDSTEQARETVDSMQSGMREVEQYINAFENENSMLKSTLLTQRARILQKLFIEDACNLAHGVFVAWRRLAAAEARRLHIESLQRLRAEEANAYTARIRELEFVLASEKNHLASQLTAALSALLPMKAEAQALERRAQTAEKLIAQIAEATGANPPKQEAQGTLSEQIAGLR